MRLLARIVARGEKPRNPDYGKNSCRCPVQIQSTLSHDRRPLAQALLCKHIDEPLALVFSHAGFVKGATLRTSYSCSQISRQVHRRNGREDSSVIVGSAVTSDFADALGCTVHSPPLARG